MKINITETTKPVYQFHCTVRIGDALERFAKPVAKWENRERYIVAQLSRQKSKIFIMN